MKDKIFIFIFSLMTCHKDVDSFAGKYPCCIQPSVNKILSEPPTVPRAKLTKFYYKDQYAYEFSPALYQLPFYTIVNENCEAICSYGGIDSDGCPEWENAEFIEVVWEDPR